MRLKTTILLLSLSVWLPNQLNAQSDSLAQSETLRDTTVITYYPNGIPHKQTTYDEEGYVDGVYMQFRQILKLFLLQILIIQLALYYRALSSKRFLSFACSTTFC